MEKEKAKQIADCIFHTINLKIMLNDLKGNRLDEEKFLIGEIKTHYDRLVAILTEEK